MIITQELLEKYTLVYPDSTSARIKLPFQYYINLCDLWPLVPNPIEDIDGELQDNTIVYIVEEQISVTFKRWAIYNKLKYNNIRITYISAKYLGNNNLSDAIWREL